MNPSSQRFDQGFHGRDDDLLGEVTRGGRRMSAVAIGTGAASGDGTGRCLKDQGSTRVVCGRKPQQFPDIVDSACDG